MMNHRHGYTSEPLASFITNYNQNRNLDHRASCLSTLFTELSGPDQPRPQGPIEKVESERKLKLNSFLLKYIPTKNIDTMCQID